MIKTQSWIPKTASALIGVLLAAQLTAGAQPLPARPPQFVLLAFDGSKSLNFWNDSRSFAQASRSESKPLDFTYFISGVYFLNSKAKGLYKGPKHVAGASDIGFGETVADISSRVEQVNAAFEEGHEMASHANGHFDGSAWSASDWASEFDLFNQLVFGVFQNNGLASGSLRFDAASVVGFRAPLLGVSAGLWPTLSQFKFRYDTSRTNSTSYWPEKLGGVWNFPLAMLKIAGTSKKTLSMDYNFYVAQSGGTPNASQGALYEQQMYETYVRYFDGNYAGNRAPVHIGHHFSLWNGGAYWRAMKRFADYACGKPEVRCITYKDYADYLDQLAPETLASYRKGEFTREGVAAIGSLATHQPGLLALADPGELQLQVDATEHGFLARAIDDQGGALTARTHLRWELNGRKVGVGASLDLSRLTETGQLTLRAGTRTHGEILSQTYELTQPNSETLELSAAPLEDQALIGDLPEAHTDEESR